MPTYRHKRMRIPKTTPLDKSISEFLLTGNCEKDSPGWNLRLTRFFGFKDIERVWLEHEALLLRRWNRKERSESQPWAVTWLEREKVNDDSE